MITENKKMFLYIIKCNEFYKIGISYEPYCRIDNMQTSNPFKLELIFKKQFNNVLKIEKELHKLFINKREIGEWFKLSEKDLLKIDRLLTQHGQQPYNNNSLDY